MNRSDKPVDFNMLCEQHTFSQEEYDLLTKRINEERAFVCLDIIRTWKRLHGKPRDTLGRWL